MTPGAIGPGETAQLLATTSGEVIVNDRPGARVHAHDGSTTLMRTDRRQDRVPILSGRPLQDD
ncbi:hypothetical protein RD110_05970 [Rhodoferax koreense]|uniref:Uncharacterized protein n=1 Tax=Rhodoferax koreensis TaxID=1842727 RepID=A0A1P8JST7_9BURK|nr:hypothetical protein RD110_05970 [Rhodoferax koreense]